MDAEAMFDDLAHLASDELGGRFSLAPTLGEAAAYLEQRLAAAGVPPVGASYRHPFPYATGITPGRQTRLRLPRGARGSGEVAPVLPRPEGIAGSVRAPVVFVGYGAVGREPPAGERGRERAPAAEPPPVTYDDLAGVDLEGKIALVLRHAPRSPDLRAMFEALEAISARFEAEAAPARKAGDETALRKAHRAARKAVADLVSPFLAPAKLPDDFTHPPDDPKAPLDLMALLRPVFKAYANRKGPAFDRRENDLPEKLRRLADRGAVGVILVQAPGSYVDADLRAKAALPDPADLRPADTPAPIPVIQIDWKTADRHFRVGGRRLSKLQRRIDRTLRPASAETKVVAELVSAYTPATRDLDNVLAWVRGATRPEEIVLVGAHYDHIGTAESGMCRPVVGPDGETDGICNGADDNASGTAMVLALARAFAGARPDRSIVFAFFAGEELGLYGSKALADHPPAAPPFEGGRIVAMINLDMVGRLGTKGLAVGGVGSSPAWMPLLDRLGNFGMKILYEKAVASRSDQANFYEKQIPVLFFFTGIHRDYHRATDEPAAINRDGMVRIARLVAETVHATSGDLPIPYRPPATPEEGLVSSLPGRNPATVVKRVGSDGTPY